MTLVLTAVGLVPGAPLIVPELSTAANPDISDVRDAALSVGRTLAAAAEYWTVIGSGSFGRAYSVGHAVGTFRGYGADVVVSLAPGETTEPDPMMPLAHLIGAWLRESVAPAVTADAIVVESDPTSVARTLFDRLSQAPSRHAVLVVADGATTLTPRAPGGYLSESEDFQGRLDEAISGKPNDLLALSEDECDRYGVGADRAVWTMLGALLNLGEFTVSEGRSMAPFGVGYNFRTG